VAVEEAGSATIIQPANPSCAQVFGLQDIFIRLMLKVAIKSQKYTSQN
jgi:hypothetical protein